MFSTGRNLIPVHRDSAAELAALRRSTLCLARSVSIGSERNQHRQGALSFRALFKSESWLKLHSTIPLVIVRKSP